ncbi:MAG: amidohydrolase family protein [Dehalococcoidia bacterium]
MIVDFHTHIVPPQMKERRDELIHQDTCLGALYADPRVSMATADELIESMDRDGIDISVAVNMGWSSLELCRRTNDYIIESTSKYRGRILGFCMVNPKWKEAAAEIERCASGGILGIGELMPHLQEFDIGDRDVMEPVMETARARNLMVMTHSSEPVGHVYAGKGDVVPGALYRLIDGFQDIRIVCAHWGGGLPFYALMPEVERAMQNVYFDTAASPFLYKYQIFQHVSEIFGDEKILFGSDFPLITQRRIIEGLDKVHLDPDGKRRILGENACRLLGIS